MTTTDRPANKRYREHVLWHCQALRAMWLRAELQRLQCRLLEETPA
jgi:hypothetical protein